MTDRCFVQDCPNEMVAHATTNKLTHGLMFGPFGLCEVHLQDMVDWDAVVNVEYLDGRHVHLQEEWDNLPGV
jgi:hypothetical protein